MIAFSTLFLGLMSGPQVVEVVVSSTVAAVELRLNGSSEIILREAPWQADIDFGDKLTGHELEAIAFDAKGAELSRVVQLINVSRQSVGSELLLDEWHDGAPRAGRLIWHSAEALELKGVSVSLDGTQLGDIDPARFELPRVDPGYIHFLVAELAFAGGKTSTSEAVFGGRFQDSIPTELSAVAVSGLQRGKRAFADASRRVRRADGSALRVIAIDHGPGEIVFVRAKEALTWLQSLDSSLTGKSNYSGTRLDKQDHLVVMSAQPHPSAHPDRKYSLFPVSPRFFRGDYPLPRALARVGFHDLSNTPERLTNAVAVAGLQAAAGKRRRMVVLVTTNCSNPSGTWSPEVVRDYLAELEVPLLVWLVGTKESPDETGGFCAGARRIASGQIFRSEIRNLLSDLDRQDIVWIEGRRLAKSILVQPERSN